MNLKKINLFVFGIGLLVSVVGIIESIRDKSNIFAIMLMLIGVGFVYLSMEKK